MIRYCAVVDRHLREVTKKWCTSNVKVCEVLQASGLVHLYGIGMSSRMNRALNEISSTSEKRQVLIRMKSEAEYIYEIIVTCRKEFNDDQMVVYWIERDVDKKDETWTLVIASLREDDMNLGAHEDPILSVNKVAWHNIVLRHYPLTLDDDSGTIGVRIGGIPYNSLSISFERGSLCILWQFVKLVMEKSMGIGPGNFPYLAQQSIDTLLTKDVALELLTAKQIAFGFKMTRPQFNMVDGKKLRLQTLPDLISPVPVGLPGSLECIHYDLNNFCLHLIVKFAPNVSTENRPVLNAQHKDLYLYWPERGCGYTQELNGGSHFFFYRSDMVNREEVFFLRFLICKSIELNMSLGFENLFSGIIVGTSFNRNTFANCGISLDYKEVHIATRKVCEFDNVGNIQWAPSIYNLNN